MKHIVVFIGGFGSGKTECAVNLALQKGREGHKTALVDMDIVNPMFRSSIFESDLAAAGVELIASESMRAAEGLPTVSDDVRRIFYDETEWVIFDVGGDDIGSVALGQFHRFFKRDDIDIKTLFVVNARRPATDTPERIVELYSRVIAASRIDVTGFLNNTNLARESEAAHLMEGEAALRRVAEMTRKPLLVTAGLEDVLAELKREHAGEYSGELMTICPKPRFPWAE